MSRPSSAGPGPSKPCGKQQHAPSPAAVLPGTGGASPPPPPPPPLPPPQQQQQQQQQELTSLFECPICFDYVLPPILQCQAGHLVCKQCRQQLSLCPTCRGSLTPNIRNLAMEKVASAVLFPCKVRMRGWAGVDERAARTTPDPCTPAENPQPSPPHPYPRTTHPPPQLLKLESSVLFKEKEYPSQDLSS